MTEDREYEIYLDTLQKIIDLQNAGDVAGAIEVISENLPKYPDKPELLLLTAVCSYRQNATGQAIELCEQAHALDPDNQEIVDSLAVLKTISGNVNDGLYFAKLATTLSPHPDIPDLLPPDFSSFFQALSQAAPSRHYLDGHYMFNGRRFTDAVSEFRAELTLNPDNHGARKMLGHALLHVADPGQALEEFAKHPQSETGNAEITALSAVAKSMLADFDAAAELCREAMDLAPESIDITMQVLEVARYFDGDLTAIYDDAVLRLKQLADKSAENCAPPPARGKRNPDGPVAIGILSNDLRVGDQYAFLMPLIENMDQKAFDLTVYQQSPTGDSGFQDFRSKSPNWRRIVDMDDEVLALILSRQRTDILLDLCGFSINNRAAVFASSPAPVVSNILCEPYGFGCPGTNVIVADAATLETDRRNIADGQEIVVTEGGLIAIKPPALMGNVQSLPAQKNGIVTFGTQYAPQTFSPAAISYWSAVLKSVEGSRLLIGCVENIPTYMRQAVRGLFDAAGVGERIDFLESLALEGPEKEFFNKVDIYLDSSPVSGRQVLCHALWMGVPVVTLKGARRSGVIGASILTSAGKQDWVGEDIDDAVGIATGLAADLDALADVRAALRDETRASKLMNTRGYTVKMLEALQQALKKVKEASNG